MISTRVRELRSRSLTRRASSRSGRSMMRYTESALSGLLGRYAMTTHLLLRILWFSRYTNMLARLLSCPIKFTRSKKLKKRPQTPRTSTCSSTKPCAPPSTASPTSWLKKSHNLFKQTIPQFTKN